MANPQKRNKKEKIKLGNAGNWLREIREIIFDDDVEIHRHFFYLKGEPMITTRLKIPLEDAEYTALLCVAGDELRNPVDQMRFILRQELQRRGLLDVQSFPAPTFAAPIETAQPIPHKTRKSNKRKETLSAMPAM